jgi:hypothetical protein
MLLKSYEQEESEVWLRLGKDVQNGDDIADGHQAKGSVALICDINSVNLVSLQRKNGLAQSSCRGSVQ